LTERIDFDVPLLVIGFPAPAASGPDALPLEIVQHLLSQGQTGRLHRRLVRDEGLAVASGGMNQCLRLAGVSLFFSVYTPDVPAGAVEAAMREEIGRIRRNGIERAEMLKVKNAAMSERVFEMYSAEHLCNRLGYAEVVEGGWRNWAARLEALQRLDSPDLVAAANRYWNEQDIHVLDLRPKAVPLGVRIAGLAHRVKTLTKRLGRFSRPAAGT
jgi:zinc protease